MKRELCCVVLAVCAWNIAAADAPKDSTPPGKVNKELLQLLDSHINLQVSDMAPSLALAWQLKLTDIPLTIQATKNADAHKVSLKMEDCTLAAALRMITEKTGIQYRLTPGTIRLAMPDEWKQIDAGKIRFEELVGKEAAAK